MGIMDRRPARRPAPATPVAAPVTPAQPAPSPAPKPTAEPAQKPAAAPAPSGAAAPHKVMRGESSSGKPAAGVPVTVVEGGPLPGAEPVTVVPAGTQPEKAEAATPTPDPRREQALRDLESAEASLARGQFFSGNVLTLLVSCEAMSEAITLTDTLNREELARAEQLREALEERIALRRITTAISSSTNLSEPALFKKYAGGRLNFVAMLNGVAADLPTDKTEQTYLLTSLDGLDLYACEDDVQDAVKELVKTLRAKPSTPPPLPAPTSSVPAPKPVGSVTQMFATMGAGTAATTAPKPAPATPVAPAPKPAAVAATPAPPIVTGPSANDLVQAHKALAESTAAELRKAPDGDAKLNFARRNPDAINQLFTAREAAVNAGGTIADGVQMMYEILVQSLLRLNYVNRVLQNADDLLERADALGEKSVHEVEEDLRKTKMLLEGLLSSTDGKERLPANSLRALTKTKDLLAETRRNLDSIENSRHGRTVYTVASSDPPDPSDRATPVPPVVARPVVTPAPWADRARVEKDADAILGRSLGAIALPLFHNADEKEYARVREKSRDLADDARKAEGLGLPYVADKCRDASRILLDAENLARLMQGTSEHVRDRKASDWREAVKNRCDRIETAIARDRTLEAGSIARLVSEWRAMATQPEPVVAPQPAPVFEPSDADKKRRTRLAIAAAAAILAVVTAFVVGVVVSLSEETPIITPPPPTAEAPAPAPSAEPPPVAAPAPAPAPTPAPPPAPPQPRCRPYTSADVGGAPLTAVPQDMLSLNQLTMPCAHASANGQTYDLSACQVCTP